MVICIKNTPNTTGIGRRVDLADEIVEATAESVISGYGLCVDNLSTVLSIDQILGNQDITNSEFLDSISVLYHGDVNPLTLLGSLLQNSNSIISGDVSMFNFLGGFFSNTQIFHGSIVAGDAQPQFMFGSLLTNQQIIDTGEVIAVDNIMKYTEDNMLYNTVTMNYGIPG